MSEDDAVAAYLARERAALGEDADLFSGSGNVNGDAPKVSSSSSAAAAAEMGGFPDLDDFTSTPSAPAPQNPTQTFSGLTDLQADDPMSNFPSLDAPPQGRGAQSSSEFKVTGHEGSGVEEDEERARFESSFPDLGGEASAIESIPYGATPYPAQPYTQTTTTTNNNNSTNTYTSILPAPTFPSTQLTEQDSPAIAQWKERQAAEIKQRDEESRRKKEDVILKAEKAIDAFYERYNEEKERSIKKNKEDEKAFLENLQESLSKGTTWERITDLIDLQNSQSKTLRASAPGGSDLARMKEVLLSLRREGDKAPAAGGY